MNDLIGLNASHALSDSNASDMSDHAAFTQALTAALLARPEVLGLILLGSTAGTHHSADAFSDHDFFVIVPDAHAGVYRAGVEWLPRREVTVVHHFRNTAHGARVIYADGHLLEYAVFTPDELRVSRNQHARVAFDRLGDLPERLVGTFKRPEVRVEAALSDFYTHLLIGVQKYRRGEVLCAHQFVRCLAAENALQLLHLLVPTSAPELVDGLNVWRRVERTHPAQAQTLLQSMLLEVPEAALALLELVRGWASGHPGWEGATADAVTRWISGVAPV